jgi:hypothetical protein
VQLEAVCAGYAVPRRDFEAEVHSAFHSAANLRLKKTGRLVTLLALPEADLPQGIRLRTAANFSFGSLLPGEQVTCREGILRCPGAALTVDLRQARRWQCDLAGLAIDLDAPSALAAWQFVAELLEEHRDPANGCWFAGERAAAREMDRLSAELTAATARLDGSAAMRNAARLVGLGAGLTPAGDDFLVGFLAGLWSSARDEAARRRFLTGLGKGIARRSHRTNDISRTYLLHAARGQVSSRLNALAGAIGRGAGPDQLRGAAAASLQVGHSSGRAATAGLLAGLAAWTRRLEA